MNPQRRGRVLWIVVIVTALIILAFITITRLKNQTSEKKALKQEPYPVRCFRVSRGPISAWGFGDGTARAVKREFLIFEQAGKITFIRKNADGSELRQGDKVKGPSEGEENGELLARVDDRDFVEQVKVAEALLNQAVQQEKASQAGLEQAKARLEVAEANYKRQKILFEKRTISESDYDVAEAELKNARSDIKAAKAQIMASEAQIASARAQREQAVVALERTRIYAPFDGVIAYLNIREGLYFSQNLISMNSEDDVLKSVPMVIIDPSEYEITIELPFFEGFSVKEGQDVFIVSGEVAASSSIESPSGEDIINFSDARGKVYSVTPAISPGERSIGVKIRTTSGAENLRDGLYVMCWISLEKKENALIAPLNAFIYRENKPYVFVVDEKTNTVEQRIVTEGLMSFSIQEIAEGVKEGDLLVTDGRYRLVSGAPVRVLDIQEAE